MSSNNKEEEIFNTHNKIIEAYKALCEKRKYSFEELLNFAAHNYAAYVSANAQINAQVDPRDSKEDSIVEYLSSILNNLIKGDRYALALRGLHLGVDHVIDTQMKIVKKATRKKSSENATNARYKKIRPFIDTVCKKWDEMKANPHAIQLGKAEFGRHWAAQLMKDNNLINVIPGITEDELAKKIERTWLRGKK